MEITLRPFELRDVPAFFKWVGDDEVTKYSTWNTFVSEEQAKEFLKEKIASHPWYRAICVGTQVVGTVAVLPGSGKNERKGQIAYSMNKDFWGKGIGTEAVKMAVKMAGEELGFLDRIEGYVFVENKASQRVLEKAGFQREGLLRKFYFVKGENRDVVVFSVVRGEEF